MNFLRTYSYTVQRYCSYNSINNVIRRCNHTLDKQEYDVRQKINKSAIYPDYEIIYKLPYVTYASILNKVKRNYTVFVGATTPIIGILTMQDFMSAETAMNSVVCSFAITAIMHIICSISNNLIGIIYYKQDDKKVIISYSNYWGKRVDLSTDVNDIILQKTTSKMRSYNKLYVKSHKKSLKISKKSGEIVEKSNFYDIFTDVK